MATAGPSAAIAVPPLQWPLVGRHGQLDLFTASLTDPRAHGFVIHGPPGVGKTRLADQCLALADREGRAVARATATEGSRSVPLGALAHLLPPGIADQRCDLVAVMAEVRPVLLGQVSAGPMVLFVDDLHLLDSTSATLVSQLVDADLVFLVATVRTAAPLPAGVESLWLRARVRRIDLDDLDQAAVDTLLYLVLRGPVEAATVAEIWRASQGNVLLVRELVLGALDRDHLLHQHGVWRLVGPLVTTPRLHELLSARLGLLDAAATAALDILAVREPVGLTTLEAIVGSAQLEVLDRSGLLSVRTDGRRQPVRLTHPLYSELLRARMPALTRRRLLLEHADRIDAHGARRREDPIRVATARLEATGSADPALLVKAARLARYGNDFPQLERLGRAAVADGVTPEAGLLLGEALHELGKFPEADDVLTAAEAASADGDALLVPITEIRTRNLMWGLLRPDEALAVNGDARERLRDRPDAEELTLNEALLLTYSGRPLDALAVLAPVPETDSPRARAMRALAELPALVATGRSATGADRLDRAFVEQMAVPDQIAIPGPGNHLLIRAYALAECGQLAEATALATAAYEATPPTAPPDAFMWLAHQIGRCALLAGQVVTAGRWLGEALARSEIHALSGPRRLVLSASATAAACRGDTEAAAAAARDLDRLPPFPFTAPEQDLGKAWALVAGGDLPGARRTLREAAARARATGYRGCESWLLHDVARLGEPATVADRLSELAGECEGELVPAYAAHARVAAAGDPGGLVSAAERFEDLGALLLAAEVATEAAQALQSAGDRRGAAAQMVGARALAGRCEGARTPGLAAPVMVSPLTPRERDIAALAARGASSKEIATRLYLSVRTVNNHLQNAYTKLGVSGRRQLAGALDSLTDLTLDADPPGPPTSSSRP
jgi:DNA-binding CsgD family transcriptional regulator/chromosome segregation and condensation protein ScpB